MYVSLDFTLNHRQQIPQPLSLQLHNRHRHLFRGYIMTEEQQRIYRQWFYEQRWRIDKIRYKEERRKAKIRGIKQRKAKRKANCSHTETVITHPLYGLSKSQQVALLKLQDKRCALCGQRRFLVLDHDHTTNKARGYLCRSCIAKLSGLDSFTHKATTYLQNPPANSVR